MFDKNNSNLKLKSGTDAFVFFKALVPRLLVLVFVILLSNLLGTEFDQHGINPDDRRYESAALIYADTADSVFDLDAFIEACREVNDVTYINYVDWFYSTPLWYWMVFIIVYLFKTIWIVRIVNILISCMTIIYLNKYCKMINGDLLAKKVTSLMIYLPCPLIFCCFAYKDQLVMFCIVYLMYWSTWIRRKEFKNRNRYKANFLKKVCYATFVSLMLMSLRSGIGAILIIIFILNALEFDQLVKDGRIRKRTIILAIGGIIAGIYIILDSFSTISYKIMYYFNRHTIDLEGSSIKVLAITSFADIYKLPATFIFSLVMPIRLFEKIDSWYNLVAGLNIVTVPVAVGATLFVIQKNKSDKFLYWGLIAVYLMSIIASITNFRHYFSLLPVIYIGFSEFRLKANLFKYQAWLIGSSAFMLLLIIYYLVF